MELHEYLPDGWRVELNNGTPSIIAPSQQAADCWLERLCQELVQTAENLGGIVELRWPSAVRGYQFDSKLKAIANTESSEPQNSVISTPKEIGAAVQKLSPATPIEQSQIDFAALYGSSNPVYIQQIADQRILFANGAALAAQQKTAAELIGSDGSALDDQSELDKMHEYLLRDRVIEQYEFPGWRFYKDDSGMWRRKRMIFIENFTFVSFLGEVCRIGEVLSAETA